MDFLRTTKKITIGGKGSTKKIEIGGDAPVSIQTMWKESLLGADLQKIAERITGLEALGCDILRFAVPDKESANAFVKLCTLTSMPLVADIHFDYTLALRCMDGPVAKIRINPGNIGSKERIKAVTDKAKDTGTAIRIGVNSGSLPTSITQEIAASGKTLSTHARAEALVKTALREAEYFDALNFDAVIISMKASTVEETVEANTLFAQQSDIPLHIGVTEAGPIISGIVKSTLAFSRLLDKNIGATVRVSLSDSMENEVIAAREILTECGKRREGIRLISCPRCGRLGFDVHAFVKRWQTELFSLKNTITIAVMGCVVNGPGEGKHADLGITGSENSVVIFKHGKVVRRLDVKNLSEQEKIAAIDAAFREELASL